MSTDYAGEMIWYEGQGVYQDGIKIAELELNSVLELLLEQSFATKFRRFSLFSFCSARCSRFIKS